MTVDNTRIELVMENVSTFAFLRFFSFLSDTPEGTCGWIERDSDP